MNKKRYRFIDATRGIGIIFVILSHSVCPEMMYFANGFFMPLFYILSGYLDKTNFRNSNLSEQVLKKGNRLIIPYLFFCTLVLLFSSLFLENDLKVQDIWGFFYSRAVFYKGSFYNNVELLNYYIRPLWFLTSLFTSFLMYFMILKIRESYQKHIICLYLLLSVFIKYIPFVFPWSLEISVIGAIYIFIGKQMRVQNIFGMFQSKVIIMCGIAYFILHYVNGSENMSMSYLGRLSLISICCGLTGTYVLISLVKKITDNTANGGGYFYYDRKKYYNNLLYAYSCIENS